MTAGAGSLFPAPAGPLGGSAIPYVAIMAWDVSEFNSYLHTRSRSLKIDSSKRNNSSYPHPSAGVDFQQGGNKTPRHLSWDTAAFRGDIGG